MNPRNIGIISGIFVIVVALIVTFIGHAAMPNAIFLPVIGLILVIMGLVVIIMTVINNRK